MWFGFGLITALLAFAFDERLFLESDAVAIGHALRQQSSLREAILQILHALDWRLNGTHPLQITIDSETYARLNGSSGAIVVTKRGALGYGWIERIVPLTRSQ